MRASFCCCSSKELLLQIQRVVVAAPKGPFSKRKKNRVLRFFLPYEREPGFLGAWLLLSRWIVFRRLRQLPRSLAVVHWIHLTLGWRTSSELCDQRCNHLRPRAGVNGCDFCSWSFRFWEATKEEVLRFTRVRICSSQTELPNNNTGETWRSSWLAWRFSLIDRMTTVTSFRDFRSAKVALVHSSCLNFDGGPTYLVSTCLRTTRNNSLNRWMDASGTLIFSDCCHSSWTWNMDL